MNNVEIKSLQRDEVSTNQNVSASEVRISNFSDVAKIACHWHRATVFLTREETSVSLFLLICFALLVQIFCWPPFLLH